MGNDWHCAIDFGTSNTSAAHTAPLSGAVETIALTHRSNLMPSAVYSEDDTILAGDSALLRGRRDASKLLLSPKRYIDHDHIQLGGHDVATLDLIAAVIRAALDRGKTQHAGAEPATVTLTHPEAWSIHSVEQLKQAAQRAGVDMRKIRTISEPRAAAVHYATQQRIQPGNHVAVFDFGGGTLDIAVLQALADGNFNVISAKGDNSLGGRTVDNLMFRWVLTQLEHDDPDFADYLRTAPPSVMHSLEESIREAKELLSDTSSATILVSTPRGERDVLITRDEFNGIIQSAVNRALEMTRAALSQAGVDARNTPIYMTGGSSRIPYVQNQLSDVGTVMTLDDPKTVVSRGALRATMRGFTEVNKEPFSQPAAEQYNPYLHAPAPAGSAPFTAYTAPKPQGKKQLQQDQESAVPSSISSFTPTGGQPRPTTFGGGKNVLLLVFGVVALIVMSAVVFIQEFGGSGLSGAKDTSTAAGSTTSAAEPSSTLTPDPKFYDSSGRSLINGRSYRHIINREPSTSDVLSPFFYLKLSICNDKQTQKDGPEWVRSTRAAGYSCEVDPYSMIDYKNDVGYITNKFIYVGADAVTAHEDIKKNKNVKARTLQEADSRNPEILIGYSGESDTSPDWAVFYPEGQVLITSETASGYRGKEEQIVRFFSFYQKF
ncbi:Hsp70 family protein [Corynebacterium hindlerae]|uniref:Hsp70 family protein n=1 Tax=Corynebacterium hindlerae TaxID=699041 RepID=UPI001AD7990B|nr:Hsp70 family protein [Corynebacterium hindlerae]QTH59411.1 Hsp70 family protein [Corynebacterium hindlerae]